eukprot:jgi/Psemu1/9389/gm1.9389_g
MTFDTNTSDLSLRSRKLPSGPTSAMIDPTSHIKSISTLTMCPASLSKQPIILQFPTFQYNSFLPVLINTAEFPSHSPFWPTPSVLDQGVYTNMTHSIPLHPQLNAAPHTSYTPSPFHCVAILLLAQLWFGSCTSTWYFPFLVPPRTPTFSPACESGGVYHTPLGFSV